MTDLHRPGPNGSTPADGSPPGSSGTLPAGRSGVDGAVGLPSALRETTEAADGLRRRLRTELSSRLADQVPSTGRRTAGAGGLDRAAAEAVLTGAAEAHTRDVLAAGRTVVPPETERRVIAVVLDEVFGLAGLQPLLDDPAIENINVNGADRVFVRYADGRRDRLAAVAGSDAELVDLIRDLAARSGVEERRFDRGAPGVSFALPDGSRAFAVMAVTGRPSLSVRRHRFTRVTLADLRRAGTVDQCLEAFLVAAVRARRNVLITGGIAIGKTTLLRALAAAIPPWERLVTVEDVFELGLDQDEVAHPDVVALQAREPNIEGEGAVPAAELVRWALRMSADRVIVGEIRGPEVVPMCNAMSQGNDGSMATLHASSSRGAFTKLAAYAAQAPERLGMEATNLLVASAVHFVVHLAESTDDHRVISSVREVVDADERQIVSNEVFRPGPDRRAIPGVPPRAQTAQELVAAGFDPTLTERPGGWWRP
jgi:pilus assembly protein CpaF